MYGKYGSVHIISGVHLRKISFVHFIWHSEKPAVRKIDGRSKNMCNGSLCEVKNKTQNFFSFLKPLSYKV